MKRGRMRRRHPCYIPVVGALLLHFSSRSVAASSNNVSSEQASSSLNLDGMAFDCAGVLIGFRGDDEVHCMNGQEKPCGEYTWSAETHALEGVSEVTGPFTGTDLFVRDGNILMSFTSVELGVTCHIVSLDWPSYSTTEFLGLKCPAQNHIPDVSYQLNHFSLGVSGDVALRSPLELVSSRRSLIRDSYGVYVWTGDGEIKMYFGPQQGQPPQVLTGILSADGKLDVDGFEPPGPCVHDGESSLKDAKQLPLELEYPNEPGCDWEKTSSSSAAMSCVFVLNAATMAVLLTMDMSILMPM